MAAMEKNDAFLTYMSSYLKIVSGHIMTHYSFMIT